MAPSVILSRSPTTSMSVAPGMMSFRSQTTFISESKKTTPPSTSALSPSILATLIEKMSVISPKSPEPSSPSSTYPSSASDTLPDFQSYLY